MEPFEDSGVIVAIEEDLVGEVLSAVSEEEDRRELLDVVLGDNFFNMFFQPAWSCDLREGSEVEI